MSRRAVIITAAALFVSAAAGSSYYFLRPVNVYRPDEDAVQIPQMKLNEYLDNGYYTEPMRTVYSADGRELCIKDSETEAYVEQNWFTEIPIEIYAADGRTMYINPSELAAYEEQNWYSEPVTLMYAVDGRTIYVKNSEIDAYLDQNWYLERPEHEGLTDLKESISQYLANRSGDWGVFIEDLSENEYLSINEKEYSGASLIKLFTMTAVFNELECGALKETDEVDSLLNQMITESSNSACNALTKKIGGGNTISGFNLENKITESIGCEHTAHKSELIDESGQHAVFLGKNFTSPRDCGRVLIDIYKGKLVSKTASDKMLELLKQQTRTWKIPSALPEGTVTANKTGENDTVQADAAIVYSSGADFVICLIGNGNVDSGVATIQNVAKMTYEYFNGNID